MCTNKQYELISLEIVNPLHRTMEVTVSAPWRTRAVAVLPNYCLSVTCNGGTTDIVDMLQFIFCEKAGIYSQLKDAQLFNQVRIESGALSWSNGADLDLVWLHEEIGKNKVWRVPG